MGLFFFLFSLFFSPYLTSFACGKRKASKIGIRTPRPFTKKIHLQQTDSNQHQSHHNTPMPSEHGETIDSLPKRSLIPSDEFFGATPHNPRQEKNKGRKGTIGGKANEGITSYEKWPLRLENIGKSRHVKNR